MTNHKIRSFALCNAEYRTVSGTFIFTETDLSRFVHRIREELTNEMLGWYNASKKAETPSDPYWRGYQDAISDAVDTMNETLEFESQ